MVARAGRVRATSAETRAVVTPPRPELDGLDLELTRRLARSGLFGEKPKPQKIGRFDVVGTAGFGAMGRVYVGIDPDLDRKVALKLIRPDGADAKRRAALRARLIREAKAVARLSHPNVVVAYEVGSVDEDVFIAMEYVPGVDVRKWLASPRPWREVVRVFVQAGSGLAAAHGRGLLHRDFKPDNVLVGDDGRVRVVDFGLARTAVRGEDSLDDVSEDHATPSRETPLESAISATGAAGTPAYIAPEVRARAPADHKSDQYSFCVSLHEALYGRRPSPTAGGPPPTAGGPPRWVRAVVRRGLQPDPGDRFPSMDALVTALSRDPLRTPKALAVVVAVAGLAAGLVVAVDSRAGDDPCTTAGAEIDRVWTPDTPAAIGDNAAAHPAYVEELIGRVVPILDDYAADWRAMRVEACESAQVRGEQSSDIVALRVGCLAQRKTALRTVVSVLEQGDLEVLRRAARVVAELPPIDACADVAALSATPTVPADRADAVAEVESQLTEARILVTSGQYDAALTLTTDARARAEAVEFRPVVASALLQHGIVSSKLGKPETEQLYRDAIWAAEASSSDRIAASGWLHLAFWIGDREHRPDDAAQPLERASAAVARIGDPALQVRLDHVRGQVAVAAGKYREAQAPLLAAAQGLEGLGPGHDATRALILESLGQVHFRLGDLPAAIRHFRQAADLQSETVGPRHPVTAVSLQNLGAAMVQHGQNREAIAVLEGALEANLQAFGTDHAKTAVVANTLGAALDQLGDQHAALGRYRQALAAFEASVGPDHTQLVSPLTNIARILGRQGHTDKAQQLLHRAVQVVERAHGPDDPRVADPLTSLGTLAMGAKDYAGALQHHRRAYEVRREALGEGSIYTAISRYNLADAYQRLGRYAEVLEHASPAAEVFAEAMTPDHEYVGQALVAIANAQLATGARNDALDTATRAEALWASKDKATWRGRARFVLARAMWDAGTDRDGALAMADKALVDYGTAEEAPPDEVERAQKWRADRRSAR